MRARLMNLVPLSHTLAFWMTNGLAGLASGLLLFMLSAGLTLVFSLMGVMNFAHASFYMLGAYFAFAIGDRIGFWPSLVLAPFVVGFDRRLRRAPRQRRHARARSDCRVAVHVRPGLSDRRDGQACLGPVATDRDAACHARRTVVRSVRRSVSALSRIHDGRVDRHAGGPDTRAQAQPYRSRDRGRPHAPRGCRGARP